MWQITPGFARLAGVAPVTPTAPAGLEPGHQAGGYVERTGIAKVHTGEMILPAGKAGPSVTVNVINETGRPLETTETRTRLMNMKETIIDVVVNDVMQYGRSRQAIQSVFDRS